MRVRRRSSMFGTIVFIIISFIIATTFVFCCNNKIDVGLWDLIGVTCTPFLSLNMEKQVMVTVLYFIFYIYILI